MNVNIHICVWIVDVFNARSHKNDIHLCDVLFSFCHWFRFHCYRSLLVFCVFILGGIVRCQMLFISIYFVWTELWTLNKMNEYLRFTMQDANQRFGNLIHHRNARYLISFAYFDSIFFLISFPFRLVLIRFSHFIVVALTLLSKAVSVFVEIVDSGVAHIKYLDSNTNAKMCCYFVYCMPFKWNEFNIWYVYWKPFVSALGTSNVE